MNAYTLAKERYAALGVDTEAVLNTLKDVTVSVHCWQGDDVVGFDAKEALSGGIQTTGNYPGKATTPEQLMADFDEVLKLSDRITVLFEGQIMGTYPGANPPIKEISLAMAGK